MPLLGLVFAGGAPAQESVTDAALAELVEGNGRFTFDLYGVLHREEGNLFYSPYSVSLALAMTYAGARGETERQMAETLHYTLPQERLHPAFHVLDLELRRRGEGARGQDGEGFRLTVANALWGQQGYGFLDAFLELLAANYGAGLRPLDFGADLEAARAIINDWVAEETEDKIQDLLSPGTIDKSTRLVLTNAIYFNAAWRYPFNESATQDGPFTLLDGTEVTVPMMRQDETFGYTEGEGYRAVHLPYDGGELTMVLLLPDHKNFEAFEASLGVEGVAGMVAALEPVYLELVMPKFSYSSEFSLVEALSELGMPDAFGDAADFSGMDGVGGLAISEVVHEAFIRVDEEGTEAAAATAVEMAVAAAVAPPLELRIDRPFIYLIRDGETGAVLFMGRVMNPLE